MQNRTGAAIWRGGLRWGLQPSGAFKITPVARRGERLAGFQPWSGCDVPAGTLFTPVRANSEGHSPSCIPLAVCFFDRARIESPLSQRYLDAPRRAASETSKRQPAIGLDKDQQAWPLIVMRGAAGFKIAARRPPALGQHHRRNHLRDLLRHFWVEGGFVMRIIFFGLVADFCIVCSVSWARRCRRCYLFPFKDLSNSWIPPAKGTPGSWSRKCRASRRFLMLGRAAFCLHQCFREKTQTRVVFNGGGWRSWRMIRSWWLQPTLVTKILILTRWDVRLQPRTSRRSLPCRGRSRT